MKSFLNNHTSRGLRNNNPGNLKKTTIAWQGKIPNGKDAVFEQFSSLAMGIRACLKDIIHDINKGKNTVRKLISEYAPPTENNTDAYVKSVSATLKIAPDAVISKANPAFLVQIARAIFKHELGSHHVDVTDMDIIEAVKLLGNVTTPLLTVDTDTNFFFHT